VREIRQVREHAVKRACDSDEFIDGIRRGIAMTPHRGAMTLFHELRGDGMATVEMMTYPRRQPMVEYVYLHSLAFPLCVQTAPASHQCPPI
jgi:hypothetical protein